LWDAGKKWGESLIHLVWFWRAAVLVLLIIAGLFAWNEPDLHQRVAATGVLFALGALLVLDLFIAFLNLPLLLYYTSLWMAMTVASLCDLVLFGRHLARSQNRIALWVLLANVALAAAVIAIWYVFQSPPVPDDAAETVAALSVVKTVSQPFH
jgi:hypothetical protein